MIAICFRPGTMISPQWLELPMSRMNFHGPKVVRAIEVLLYVLGIKNLKLKSILQSNFDGSNTDGSFTMVYSFLSPYGIFPIPQEHITYIEGHFLILLWNCMLFVLIRIASSRRF